MTELIGTGLGVRPRSSKAAASPVPWHTLPAGAVLVSCAALIVSVLWRPPILLLWNTSPSSPVGLYAVEPWKRPGVGDMVIAWPPRSVRHLAAIRHYLPLDVPLVKGAAARAGSRVCASGRTIMIDGRPAAFRRSRDRAGRRLPWWTGCRRLGKGDLFLLNPAVADSFDGRYFGVTGESDVLGRGRPIWRG